MSLTVFTAVLAGILGLVSGFCGLRAARLSVRANKVEVIPAWGTDSLNEPVMPDMQNAGWTAGILTAQMESGLLNAAAARWGYASAAAGILGAVSGIAAAIVL